VPQYTGLAFPGPFFVHDVLPTEYFLFQSLTPEFAVLLGKVNVLMGIGLAVSRSIVEPPTAGGFGRRTILTARRHLQCRLAHVVKTRRFASSPSNDLCP
jgi:hypothetical protein